MKICDLCEGQTKELTMLDDDYQCYNVKEVCSDCLAELDGFILEASNVLHNIMKRRKLHWYKRWVIKLRREKGLTTSSTKDKE